MERTTPSQTGIPPKPYPKNEHVIITHPQNRDRTAEAFWAKSQRSWEAIDAGVRYPYRLLIFRGGRRDIHSAAATKTTPDNRSVMEKGSSQFMGACENARVMW